LEAVRVGHHEVVDDDVRSLVAEFFQRIQSIAGQADGELFCFEAIFEYRSDVGVVDNEGLSPPRTAPCQVRSDEAPQA